MEKRIISHARQSAGNSYRSRSFEMALVLAKYHEVFYVSETCLPPDLEKSGAITPICLPPVLGDLEQPQTEALGRKAREILETRKHILEEAVHRVRPDIYLVERFPFGLENLSEEYLATIQAVRQANQNAQVLCSLGDIPARAASAVQYRREVLGPETDRYAVPGALKDNQYRQVVCDVLNTRFDALFIHADPWLTRLEEHFPWVGDIETPIEYTGYIASEHEPPGATTRKATQDKYVLVDAGSGGKRAEMILPCIQAWQQLAQQGKIGSRKMIVRADTLPEGKHGQMIESLCSTGPFQLGNLSGASASRAARSELSISRAGYTTCVHLLQTQTRALLLPDPQMDGQIFRALRLSELGLVDVLPPGKQTAEHIAQAILKGLVSTPQKHTISLDGAERTAQLITEFASGPRPAHTPTEAHTASSRDRKSNCLSVLFLMDTHGLGGSEIWIARMANALILRGHTCAIGAPLNSRLHNYTGAIPAHFTYTYMDALNFIQKLVAFIEAQKIDTIVCTPNGQGLESWALNQLCYTMQTPPAILFKIGLPPYAGSKAQHFGYGLHPAFCRLLVVCNHNRKQFLNTFPELSREFIRTQYTGINLNEFRPDHPDLYPDLIRERVGISGHAPLVVNVSRVCFLKGQALLLQAAHTFLQKFPEAHLLIVGTGPQDELARLKAFAKGLGLGHRIHFWEFEPDVRSILAAATVFVLPSLIEGIPNAMLEAMAMGKPCIATNICGVPELATDQRDALLVPVSDIDALASAVCRLLGDPELSQKLATNALKRAQEYSLETRANQFEQHLIQASRPAVRFSWRLKKGRALSPRREFLPATRSILVTQSEGMGDQIQSYPFLYTIRKAFKKQSLTLLVPESRKRLFEHFGYDEIVAMPQADNLEKCFRGRHFDLAFDLNLRAKLNPCSHLDIGRLVSFPKEAPLADHRQYQMTQGMPLWKQFLGLLRAVGISHPVIPWARLRPTISQAEYDIAHSLLQSVCDRVVIGVSPGGFTPPEKQWGEDNFASILDRLAKDHPICPVLFGHFREVPLAWQLAEKIDAPVLNLANSYPGLGVLFALLDLVGFHLTNDNGVMHMAAVLGTPQIALFGPTDHRMFGPMGRSSRLIISPTNKMADIPFGRVLRACRTFTRRALPHRQGRSESPGRRTSVPVPS